MPKRSLIELSMLLFDTFANPQPSNPQPRSRTWAIHESISRLGRHSNIWRTQDARKEHVCIRGCPIQPGHVYVLHASGAGWGNDLKFCINCAAMVFYFMHVDKLPPYMGTHWDRDAECSVVIEGSASY